MVFAWWAAAFAAPISVVAIGDGLAPPTPTEQADHATPNRDGGWVAVVADCLEERAAGKFRVIDRVEPPGSPSALLEKSRSLIEIKPQVVLVGLGAPPTGSVEVFRRDLTTLTDWWRAQASATYLIGVVDPREGATVPVAFDAALKDVARTPGVVHVDLLSDWPTTADRAALVTPTGHLSAQGQARVGAAACDAILSRVKP